MKKLKRQLVSIASLPVPLLVLIISVIPSGVLYYISSLISFVLFRVVGYRKKVVLHNLNNSFPEKSPEEIMAIAHGFYKHMADVIFESVKSFSAPEKEIRNRIKLSEKAREIFNKYHSEKRSIIVVMGHYGNWEWICSAINLRFQHYPESAYKPLKNKVINWLLLKIRSRFCKGLIPSDLVAKHLINLNRNKQTKAFVMIADQAASPSTAFWMDFLNQDTPFFTGPEKLSVKFSLPVVFCSIRKKKRGHYEVNAEVITNDPGSLARQEITRKFAGLLEAEIRMAPQYWLWSHRRWKHKRKTEKSLAVE